MSVRKKIVGYVAGRETIMKINPGRKVKSCTCCGGTGYILELNVCYMPIYGTPMPENKPCTYCNGTGMLSAVEDENEQ